MVTGTFRVVAEAAAELAGTWSVYTGTDIGPKLTCREAEALWRLLTVAGGDDVANALIVAHAASDEPEDDSHELIIGCVA